MDGSRSAHIVYFSGTGGTERAAGHLERALSARGVGVTVTALGKGPYPPVKADLLAVLFPVYAANAPQPVYEWIAAAPRGNGTRAAVISVSGGGEVSPNTACRLPTIRRLERKGYDVGYEQMLVMPSNCLVAYGDEFSALLLRAAPYKTAKIADDLLAGVRRRTRPGLPDRVITRLASIEHTGSKWFGKSLCAGGNCNGCGLCAARCPRGNIEMRGGKPVFGGSCVICLRCVYGCPRRAIAPGFLKSALLKDGYDLALLEARTRDEPITGPVEGYTEGKAYAGVRKYLLED